MATNSLWCIVLIEGETDKLYFIRDRRRGLMHGLNTSHPFSDFPYLSRWELGAWKTFSSSRVWRRVQGAMAVKETHVSLRTIEHREGVWKLARERGRRDGYAHLREGSEKNGIE